MNNWRRQLDSTMTRFCWLLATKLNSQKASSLNPTDAAYCSQGKQWFKINLDMTEKGVNALFEWVSAVSVAIVHDVTSNFTSSIVAVLYKFIRPDLMWSSMTIVAFCCTTAQFRHYPAEMYLFSQIDMYSTLWLVLTYYMRSLFKGCGL